MDYSYRESRFDDSGFLACDTWQVLNSTKPRIVAIGDSNTFGYPVRTEASFAEQLDRLLPDIDVINLGVNGYTSEQGRRILLKRGLDLNPSFLLVSFNYNDRRYVFARGDRDGDAHFTAVTNEAARRSWPKKLRLFRVMSRLLPEFGGVAGALASRPVDISKLYPRVSPQRYRENLEHIVRTARARGIKVVFILLRDNPVLSAHLRTGARHLELGEHQLAVEHLRLAVESGNIFSVAARIQLSRAYQALGEPEKARKTLALDEPMRSLHGGWPLYLDTEYNAVMRDVAEKNAVSLVNAADALDRDPSTFVDYCHFDELGHRIVAELLYDEITKQQD